MEILDSATGERNRVPETHLAVAGGVDVPRGSRLEEPGEPRPPEDEGSERVLHCGGIDDSAGGGASRRGRVLGICAKWQWAEIEQNFWESSGRHVEE